MVTKQVKLAESCFNKEKVLEISARIYSLEKQIADQERLYNTALKNKLPVFVLDKIFEEKANLRRKQNIYKSIPLY